MPTSSGAQSIDVWAACEKYTQRHGPRFNVGPQKSARLILGSAVPCAEQCELPTYCRAPVPDVVSYTYVGVLLDCDLKFGAHLKRRLALGRSAFDKLWGAGTSAGIPHVHLAVLVPTRVVGTMLHGLAFCIAVPAAEAP